MPLISFCGWGNWGLVRLIVLLKITQHKVAGDTDLLQHDSRDPTLKNALYLSPGPSTCEVLGLRQIHWNKNDLCPVVTKETESKSRQCNVNRKIQDFRERTQESSTLFSVLRRTWSHSILTHYEVVRASILLSTFYRFRTWGPMCMI